MTQLTFYYVSTDEKDGLMHEASCTMDMLDRKAKSIMDEDILSGNVMATVREALTAIEKLRGREFRGHINSVEVTGERWD